MNGPSRVSLPSIEPRWPRDSESLMDTDSGSGGAVGASGIISGPLRWPRSTRVWTRSSIRRKRSAKSAVGSSGRPSRDLKRVCAAS